MDEIAALLTRMRELEPETYVYGPASEDAIQRLASVFGHPMPPSYRAFLSRFGSVFIVGTTYSGIIDGKIEESTGWAWTDTQVAREDCQLPSHYLVVEPDQDGFACLDFSRTGPDSEHPVIYHMPFRQTPFHELGQTYGMYLTGSLQAMVEAWAEDA